MHVSDNLKHILSHMHRSLWVARVTLADQLEWLGLWATHIDRLYRATYAANIYDLNCPSYS